MDHISELEEVIMRLTGMFTTEVYLSECSSMPDGDACMHYNMVRELKEITEALKKMQKEMEDERSNLQADE